MITLTYLLTYLVTYLLTYLLTWVHIAALMSVSAVYTLLQPHDYAICYYYYYLHLYQRYNSNNVQTSKQN